jgi:hypothetical protein
MLGHATADSNWKQQLLKNYFMHCPHVLSVCSDCGQMTVTYAEDIIVEKVSSKIYFSQGP